MDRSLVLTCLRAITYASGKAYVALSKGDTATYFKEIVYIEQCIADIHVGHEIHLEIIKHRIDDEGD